MHQENYSNGIYIGENVKIGQNVTIMPLVYIDGDTTLGDGCVIEPFSHLFNAQIGEGAVIRSSRIINSSVGKDAYVGPFAHLRENSIVGENCRVGNFVEMKASALGAETKAAHLAYIGDAQVGKNCNIGCGAIFVNYDGKTKHKTVVGNNVFIGSNSNLIAPLCVEDDCFIACGTTLTKDLAADDFAIGRKRTEVKPSRAHHYLKKIKE